ncbi:hypothetical protein ACLKA7_016646 [Drosophila subpalustris]
MPLKRTLGGGELATATAPSPTGGSALSHFKMAVESRPRPARQDADSEPQAKAKAAQFQPILKPPLNSFT